MTNKFEQMLERLINEDREGAEELFHEIVVEKSRDIYESLLEDDLEVDEAAKDDDEDEEVEEAEEKDDDEDEEMDEGFDLDEFEVEADDDDMNMGGDPTDKMLGDIEMDDEDDDMDMDMDDEDDDEDELEDRVVDVEDAIDQLKAEFERKLSGIGNDISDDDVDVDDDDDDDTDDKEGKDAEGDDEEAEEESYNFEADDEDDDEEMDEVQQMREYVEKVTGGHGAESKGKAETADNKKSSVAGKNNMGGTSANIAKGGEEKGGNRAGLADINPKEEDMGNVNKPGGKASKSMKAQPKGHGAEKKGAGETASNKKSTLGS